jgi:DNA mismatch repair protein MutS2
VLRDRRHALTAEIEQRLRHLLYTPALREAIADHYVTQRNQRFVIPVRASRHGQIPGVAQDRSASGETLFVEPLFAVDLNNRLLLTKKEEEAEEQRVLLELTAMVRSDLLPLTSVFTTLTEIDVLYAKASWARKQQSTKPNFGGTLLRLPNARHPLLLATGKPVVPIDLLIPEGKCGLLITGPNTGGKTAALKTVGLLCLMAQSGMLIPVAADNHLPIFQGIFADIGDPQSLEQNLSTFSAHLQNIVDIASQLSAQSLLVLDDPGGGTDPAEGGALACGLFTYFKACGAIVVAATHLMSVKLFAVRDGTYQVAAVDFEVETLTPHYTLRYDIVGQSLGLAIARRLGVPEAACTAAEAALAPDARQMREVLAQLHETQATLDHERAATTAERERLTALRQRQEAVVTELEEKKRRLDEELKTAKQDVQTLRREGRTSTRLRERPSLPLALTASTQPPELPPALRQQQGTATGAAVQIGDEVEALAPHIRGELVALRRDRARIRQNGMTFDVPLAHIRKVS